MATTTKPNQEIIKKVTEAVEIRLALELAKAHVGMLLHAKVPLTPEQMQAHLVKLYDELSVDPQSGRDPKAGNTGNGQLGSSRGSKTALMRTTREQSQAIRAWAREQGFQVGNGGAIRSEVMAAYRQWEAQSVRAS